MTEPSPAESETPDRFTRLWKRVPPRLLGGRFRTTTVVMCVLWLGLSILNGYLNPTPPPVTEVPAPAGVEQSRYVPPPPAEKSSTQPSTSESSAPSETSGTSTPSPTPPSGNSSTSSATTTPGEQREPPPFQFPGENRTTPSETSQSEPGPTETTPRNETTVVPSPEG